MSTLKQYTGTSWDVVTGDAGQSAYQIAVSNGYSGTEQEWLAYIRATEPISGNGPPSVKPVKIGDRYIDTANKITYTANGTTSISDWIQDSYPILSTTSFTGTPLVGTIVIDPAGSYNIDYLSPTGNGSLLTNLQTSQMSDAVSVSRQQSITNKYLNENNVFFQSNEYPTRLAKIEVTDNVPDNTTRVITLPNHDCTLDKITSATTSNIVGPLISNGTSVVAVSGQNSYPYLGSASDPVFHIPTVSQMILPVIKPLTNVGNITVTQADGTTAIATVDTTNKRVGIGIAAPTQALDVVGSIKSSATVTATTSVVTPIIQPVSDGTSNLQIKSQSGTAIVTVDSTNYRVGIGNVAPTTTLDVTGTINASSGFSGPSQNSIQWSTSAGMNLPAAGMSINSGICRLLLGSSWSTYSGFYYYTAVDSFHCILRWMNPDASGAPWQTLELVPLGGNVAIGTSTAPERLTVSGNIACSGMTTQNSITRKLSFSKVMVSGALTDVVTFTLAAGETISGVVNYSITATGTVGGVAHQYEHNGLVHFSFINNTAGGYFGNIAETEGSTAKSTGGTFTDSFTPKANAATLQATIDASGLTTPVITFSGQIEVHRPLTITLN